MNTDSFTKEFLKDTRNFDRAEAGFDDEYDFDKSAELVAKQRGLVVVYPEENQLQVDIDTDDQYRTFCHRYDSFGWDVSVKDTPSNSGLPHRHLTLTCKG